MIEVTPVSTVEVTKDEAIMACFACNYNGKKGWRIPTVNEYIKYGELAYNIWDQDEIKKEFPLIATRLYQFIRTVDVITDKEI